MGQGNMADKRQPIDIYDKNAMRLLQHGYHPVPIAPLGFETKKCPVQFNPNELKFYKLSNWGTAQPITDSQPGANIGAVMGKGIVALDYDHDDAAVIISDALPSSPVNKAGERGFTAFYRTDFDVSSEDFINDDGELVLQVLSDGKQTVIPPSIHPDTCQPYRWTNGHSLYDTPREELPLLPRDYRDRILNLGFKTGRPAKERAKADKRLNSSDQGEPSGPFAELNQMAIRDLAKWVPELNIYKCRRRVGWFANYEGVAQWREGTTGKKLEDRAPNLKISGMGIRDFGDNRGYSPLDLVMAARASDLCEAYCWLDEKLRPKSNISDADLDKLVEQASAPSVVPAEEPDPDMTEAEAAVLGPMWAFGDPIPAEEPMLVPVFVPARPLLGFLGGQRSTFKTFVTNDLAVAIASGGEFAGQRVAYSGLVVQIELEGSLSRVRVTAAANHRGVKERLPIWQSNKIPPSILVNRRQNPEWKKWVDVFVRVVRRKAKKLGIPLALITMDPAMYFAGVTDNNDWAQWTDVCKALIGLAQCAECPVLVVDHYGKDEDRGLIGSAAKEAAAHFVLGFGGERESRENRELVVRKMKDGPAYICVDFDLDTYDVTLSKEEVREDGTGAIQEQIHTTLVIKWGREVRAVDAAAGKEVDGDHLTELQRTAVIKLITLINGEGAEIPSGCGAATGARGIRVERWFERLSRGRVLGDRGQSEANFKKLVTALQAKRRIEVFDPWVWIPLDPNAGA
jgi:hypothetical protein